MKEIYQEILIYAYIIPPIIGYITHLLIEFGEIMNLENKGYITDEEYEKLSESLRDRTNEIAFCIGVFRILIPIGVLQVISYFI